MSRWRLGSFGRRETHFPLGEIVFSTGEKLLAAPKLFSQPEKTFRRMENAFFRAFPKF